MNQTVQQILSDLRIQAAAELNIRSEIEAIALEYGERRTGDKAENDRILGELLARQRVLSARYHGVVLWLDRVNRALEALPDSERELLVCVYCEDKSPLDVMEALMIEKSSYYRLRKKALEHFSKAFHGTPDPAYDVTEEDTQYPR